MLPMPSPSPLSAGNPEDWSRSAHLQNRATSCKSRVGNQNSRTQCRLPNEMEFIAIFYPASDDQQKEVDKVYQSQGAPTQHRKGILAIPGSSCQVLEGWALKRSCSESLGDVKAHSRACWFQVYPRPPIPPK